MRVFDCDVRDVSHEPYWWVRRLGGCPDWANYDTLVEISERYPPLYNARFWCVFSRVTYKAHDVAVILVTKLEGYLRGRVHAKTDSVVARRLPSVIVRLMMHSWRSPTMDLDVCPVLQSYFSGYEVVDRKKESATYEEPSWLLPYVRFRLVVPYTPDLPLLWRTPNP